MKGLKLLRKQLSDNTGSNRYNYRHLAFVIIKSFAVTIAAQVLTHTVHSHRAIAQPTSNPSRPSNTEHTEQANTAHAMTNLAMTNLWVEAVAQHLEGIMSTTEQAENDPNFVGVQMTTCRIDITEGQPNSIYLYQEQALTASLETPYRQRFLQITPADNTAAEPLFAEHIQTDNRLENTNRIHSRTFKPENESEWTGLCNQPERTVFSAEIGEYTCTISLRAASIGGFVGSTPPEGCTTNVRGAVSITNVVVLHEHGMDTWDRGLDAEGNQVWGAQNIPYQYRR